MLIPEMAPAGRRPVQLHAHLFIMRARVTMVTCSVLQFDGVQDKSMVERAQ